MALVGTEVVEGGGHVASVPESDGVDGEPEGAELVLLALAVGLAQFAAVAVEDLAGQRVAGLAPVAARWRRCDDGRPRALAEVHNDATRKR